MSEERIGKFKLGKKYRDTKTGNVYKVIALCHVPSITLESEDGEKINFGFGGAIGDDLEEIKEGDKMNREIKFRAWSKLSNKMHYELEEAHDDMDILDILSYYKKKFVIIHKMIIK
ncbi:MAG: hypothetical protein ACOC1K_04755 [Nanoarchaeota archaeon]